MHTDGLPIHDLRTFNNTTTSRYADSAMTSLVDSRSHRQHSDHEWDLFGGGLLDDHAAATRKSIAGRKCRPPAGVSISF